MRRVLGALTLNLAAAPAMAAAGLTAALATFIPVGPAGAATTINASQLGVSDTIIGTLGSHGSYAIPWTIQVASDPGQCVRLEVAEVLGGSGLDLEMVVVSPAGRVFRSDNAVGNRLPLVRIAPTEQGFYTVQVSTANGGAAAVNFKLLYGRFPVDLQLLPGDPAAGQPEFLIR